MPLVLADRVKETTTTVGTGTITLGGAATGFQSFAVIGSGNTTYYTIAGQGTNEWEVGIGTYTASGTTLSRDTVLASSAGAPTKTAFSSGPKDVFVTYPAGRAAYTDGTNIVGNANTATNLSTNRSNWANNGTLSAVVGQLVWRNYNNGHTIFDASASLSPDGTAVNNANSQVAWTGSYPTLMGWNGSSTYGVRVDSCRTADNGIPAGTVMLFAQTSAPTGWTKSTAHDNKALRVVSGTAGSGGSVPFTTAFAVRAAGGTVLGATLAESQIPGHQHSRNNAGGAHNSGYGNAPYTAASGFGSPRTGLSSVVGGGGAHDHGFVGSSIDLTVQYVDVIIATKN
jgi:hypothetical protein